MDGRVSEERRGLGRENVGCVFFWGLGGLGVVAFYDRGARYGVLDCGCWVAFVTESGTSLLERMYRWLVKRQMGEFGACGWRNVFFSSASSYTYTLAP